MPTLTTQQRAILLAASLAVGLAFLDETAVVTALRAIQREFGVSSPALQWVVGAYLLALASLMAAAGRLADLYGRRRLFLAGTALFGLGSIACAAAPSALALVLARAVQGTGAALLVPLGYAIATIALPEERRGWALGVVSTGATVFLALGPVIGGTLTELVGWRWIFALNVVPVGAILAISLRHLGESRGDEPEPLDRGGLVLLVGGLAALTTTLLQVQEWGAGAPATIALGIAAVALLGAFVVSQRRGVHPLIDLGLLRIPSVAGSLCALFAIQFAILGLTVYLTLYLQHVLGYSPAVAGLLSLPTVVAAPFLALPTGRLSDRRGTRALTAGAMGLAAVALLAIALLADRRDVALLLPAFLAFGIARPVATVAATAGAVGAIPQRARGLASALVTQSRQLGAVLGVAVLGLVLTAGEHARRTQMLDGVDASFTQAERAALDGLLVDGADARALLAPLPPAVREQAREAAAGAYVTGFELAMLVVGLLALAAAVLGAILIDRERTARVGAPARSHT